MRKPPGQLVVGVALLALGGCGTWLRADIDDAPEAEGAPTASDNSGLAAESGSDGPPPDANPASPVDASVPSPGTHDPSADLSDPGVFDPESADELLSAYLDSLLLDLLDPSGTTGPFGSQPPFYEFTYLEQICRDEGLSDSFCRSRYGP